MTEKETEYANKYPEARLIVAMAESVWIGNRRAAKIKDTIYIGGIERGNNQIGVITLWKKKG